MTACRNKARGAVVAALAGALTLGAAPVMALAVDGGAALLTAGDLEDIAGGAITAYTDQDGDECTTEFVANGKPQYVVPTEVTTKLGSVLDVQEEGLSVTYYEASEGNAVTDIWLDDEDGEPIYVTGVNASDIKDAGTYYVAVGLNGEAHANQRAYVKFTIVNRSLKDAVVTGKTKDDTTLYYTGANQSINAGDVNVYVGDAKLEPGTDYTFELFRKGGAASGVVLNEAGDYVLRLTGKSADYKGSVVEIPVKVNPIDLSVASIVLNGDQDATSGTVTPTSIDTIDGNKVSDGKLGDAVISFEFVSASNGSTAPSTAKGAYTYKVSAKNADGTASANVINDAEVTVTRYDKAADFEYDGKTWPADVEEFDASKVSVKGGKEDLDFEISYTKEVNGKQVGVSEDEITLPGKYTAIVTVADDTYTYGGTESVTFEVAAKKVSVDDIFVTYDGDIVENSASDVYNGSDFLGRFSVKAFDEDGEEVPASEFDVKVIDEATKDEVDSIVNKGTYTISVETKDGSMYAVDGADNSVKFTVNAVDTSGTGNADIRFAGTMAYGADADKTYLYTGEAVVPTFEYDLKVAPYDTEKEWIALSDTSYKATYEVKDEEGNFKKVDECVEPGDYRVTLKDSAKDANYNVSNRLEFKISDTKVFADVANNEWYSEYVYKAASTDFGYMKGYGEGVFFGPADSISRADVVQVLFNMAGQPGKDSKPEGSTDADQTFDLPYTDCDEGAYYAQALQWATKLGIVSGDEGKDTFRPTDPVTREELAKIMYNYMALQGETEDVDADAVLGEYEDESSVSAWAREYVAWLVEQGVMGQDSGLEGNKAISRAEVATMAVRLQPNGKLSGDDFLAPVGE